MIVEICFNVFQEKKWIQDPPVKYLKNQDMEIKQPVV